MNIWRRFPTRTCINRLLFQDILRKNLCNIASININITSQIQSLQPQIVTYSALRLKSKKAKYDSDDEQEDVIDDDDDISLNKDSKVVKFNTTSLRTDAVLKLALGISRNKVEQAFYESKIRVNGKKILKKSASIKIGDELDIIKMVSPKNPDHLYVSRVEIMNAAPKEESITITARRFKNLLIENYEQDPYKGGSTENE